MLNENNIQAPFQYKIGENDFELLTRNGELELNTNNVQVKVFEGQRLFCADIGYAIDGALEEMEFLIDDIKVYPVLLEELKDLKSTEVNENEIYLVKNDINFKSIIFFPPIDLNKNFKYTITTYSSTFSAFMFDEIAKKLNVIDVNAPIKNFYEDTDYKINDIIKYNGYLYRVFKDFTSDDTDYYLINNCNLITPFKKIELNTEYKINDLVEYNNNFFTVQSDFTYEEATNLNDVLKPIEEIIEWDDNIKKVYKNQIILKDDFCYLVLVTSENYTFDELLQFKKIDYLNKAINTFYDDTNSGFGNNTNTVQKAIEKLKSDKQGSLIAGNNIALNGNKISVIGGTNKEYIINSNYYIDDLIIYDSKLYKVNENFIASDWTADRNKCTLVSGGSGKAAEASQVEYDNSKTNLEYISGYDFPKFKIQIPDSINLILSDNINDYTASIIKQEDGSYIFNASLTNYNIIKENGIAIYVKSIEGNSNYYQIYSILSQFFEFINVNEPTFYQCEEGEITVSDINNSLEFAFTFLNDEGIVLYIIRNDKIPIAQADYNILINIKNRVLMNQDINLFLVYTLDILCNFSLIQNDNKVSFIGTYTSVKTSDNNMLYFYSSIIENYFNLTDSLLKLTSGITSSSGKAVKFGIVKNKTSSLLNNDSLYTLYIAYDDGSQIQEGDIFTFNLIPDKNYILDPTYAAITNVQQLGEALTERFNKLDLIADGEEHQTGTFYYNANGGRKPIYYLLWESSGTYSSTQILFPIQNIDKLRKLEVVNANFSMRSTYVHIYNQNSGSIYNFSIYRYGDYVRFYNDVINMESENLVNPTIYLEYTKTTDSWEY